MLHFSSIVQEAIHSEIKSIEENISRTRGRIVQSPERIKKAISVMSATVLEDKKLITMHEAKARDLQAKVTALYNIEKVRGQSVGLMNQTKDHLISLARTSEDASNSYRQSSVKFIHYRCLKKS